MAAAMLLVVACSDNQPDGQIPKNITGAPLQAFCFVPLTVACQAAQPVWVKIEAGSAVQANSWLPIFLTPDMAERARAEKQHRSRLAQQLAEKAYYFGYATNEDALE
ncbi:MAG: hypothetical protein AUJ57_04780 [Zetaproteobacteria bacterium CG1_02_53_45]|nr:MAG: hypothetical protein AUJ57_04780 [Zetaproteobacteria bacterium CG1_02_53_45]